MFVTFIFMDNVFLLIGGNLGNRLNNIKIAEGLIAKKIGSIAQKSNIYQTAAWGNNKQPHFLNKIIICSTNLTPQQVLKTIFEIETLFKRERHEKWGARTMDIDIIFYNDLVINSPSLTIPHPLVQQRRFALVPLNEVAPNFIHPILKTNVANMLANCLDRLEVEKFLGDDEQPV